MINISVQIELNYVFFSLLLVIYSVWRYSKRKEKGWLYLTLGFTFLTCSATIRLVSSLLWLYRIYINITTSRLLELSALAMFACFIILAIMALRKISDTSSGKFQD